MRKIVLCAAAVLGLCSATFAQVLPKNMMKNTSWIGFGKPLSGDPMFYGLTDTFQARFDIGSFTIEGMLNWSLLANYDNEGDVDNFSFGTSNRNPLSLHYGYNYNTSKYPAFFNNAANVSNVIQDSYYVNFLWHFSRNFDFGVGTKLNWQVGPAPRYGSWLWESDAHVRQGGFSTIYDDRSGSYASTSTEAVGSYKFSVDEPGSADVVGFVPYANKYAKRALGIRFVSDGNIGVELGAAIPNGFNTDNPAFNFAAKIIPVDWLEISAVMEGAFESQANFYAGSTIGADNFVLDLYLAMDSLFTDAEDDEAYGLGAAITFEIPRTEISLRPEIGFNFFENSDYTMAWYAAGDLSFDITRDVGFGLWVSYASGSSKKSWDDREVTKDYDGGHIFDIRPSVDFAFSRNIAFTGYADLEFRTAFDGQSRDCWSAGCYMTYTF